MQGPVAGYTLRIARNDQASVPLGGGLLELLSNALSVQEPYKLAVHLNICEVYCPAPSNVAPLLTISLGSNS